MGSLWAASYIVLWLVVAALAELCMGLLRQLGLIQLRLGADPGVLITPEGLPRGTPAPEFEGIDIGSRRLVKLHDYRGRKVVLAFIAATCGSCRALVPHLNDIAREWRDSIDVIVVCYGSEPASEEYVRQLRLDAPLISDPTNAIALRYDTHVTPFMFLVDESGLIRIRGVVNTWPQLEALLNEEGTFQGERPWKPLKEEPDTVRAGSAPGVGVPSTVLSK